MKFNVFTSLVLLLPCSISAQVLLSGKILDENNQPVESVSITLSEKNSNIILAYSLSDRKGLYSLSWNGQFDSVRITVSSMGYARKEIIIPVISSVINFSIKAQATILKEVKLKSSPVWQRKDTINYIVSEFKQQQDRVIGDIIARLPGIEVSPGGQIKYNGKPINKYYIEGLDLLEDKYGLANSNIPAESVEKVQVLENHQPIRVLDSVSFSDKAALNIKLKSTAKVKLIGRAKVGIGASPLLSEDEATPMLFKKKIQFINTYKYNNTGLDNVRELSSQNFMDFINAIQNGSAKNDLVGVVKPNPPSFSSSRYLFNNAHTASVNVLVPLKKDLQLRINASYINDFQQQQSNIATKYYLPFDTISIYERNTYYANTNKQQTEIALMANTPKYYLKNNTKFIGWWQKEGSTVVNSRDIKQQLENPLYNFFNDFRLLKTKAKHINEWGSYIGYVSMPQQLAIFPGLYEQIVNNNVPYEGLFQNASIKTFYTDNYFSFRKRKSKFGSYHKIGFNIQRQDLLSDLEVLHSGIKKSVADTFQNNINWNRYRFYAENNWAYETNKIRLSFALPIIYTIINYKDTLLKNEQHNQRLFSNPTLSFMYQINPKWNLNASASYANNFGEISGITNGYILKTYRNLSNNNAPLAETGSRSVSASLTFRNPLKIVFFNTGIAYSNNKSNLLYRQRFNGNLETLEAILQNNFARRTTVTGRFSKYFIDLKTSFGINFSYTFGRQQQIQQTKLITFANKNYSIGTNITTKLSSKMNVDYSANYFTYSSASQFSQSKNNIASASQKILMNYFPCRQWMVNAGGEHYYITNQFSSSRNYFFADINFRYKPEKSKIDYEISVQNVFNTSLFTTAVLSNNIETLAEYQIRSRQVLFKMSFSF